MSTVATGLAITGALSLFVAMAPQFWLIAALLLIASIGNPIYAVGNQTALLESVRATERGSVMSIRFAVVQTALVSGAAFGAQVTGTLGPRATYATLGVGLCAIAVAAVALKRFVIANDSDYVVQHAEPAATSVAAAVLASDIDVMPSGVAADR
jgi:predicted MFS family arabinose efflux permease